MGTGDFIAYRNHATSTGSRRYAAAGSAVAMVPPRLDWQTPRPMDRVADAPGGKSPRFFCNFCPKRCHASRVTQTPRIIDGSLVSVDISGFTALSERLAATGREGAEELVRTISAILAELIAVAERYGGGALFPPRTDLTPEG